MFLEMQINEFTVFYVLCQFVGTDIPDKNLKWSNGDDIWIGMWENDNRGWSGFFFYCILYPTDSIPTTENYEIELNYKQWPRHNLSVRNIMQ